MPPWKMDLGRLEGNYIAYLFLNLALCRYYKKIFELMGSDTSPPAIEAIGGLNLPGGGGGVAPIEKTLREVKLLSYVNKVSRII